MKRSFFILFLISVNLLILPGYSYSYWVWSPKTGKWINPIYKIFDDPQEQFNWAKGYYDEGDYRKAIFEFKKILKKFSKSMFASEAKFYIGMSQEKLHKYYHAFKSYQSVIDEYPLNERLNEIVEKQYLIGEIYFKKKKYELARKIFQQTLDNAPYIKVSDVAQYKIGLCYLKMRNFVESRDEFEKLTEDYSFSTYLDDASFQIGFCSFKLSSLVKDYDQGLVDRAIDDLEYFLRRFQTSEYVIQAESLLNKLRHVKAARFFEIAQFYEKQKKTFAALKYYEEVVYSYGQTEWAKKARSRISKLRTN